MPNERFPPISVKPPSKNHLLFWARCWFDLQLGTIVKHLRPAMRLLNGHILDIGAGECPWKNWLPLDCTYQGIDVDNANEFGMINRKKDIVYYNGKDMPFPASTFDGALCIEVMEHVKNPDEFLSEISRVMKTGGTLLLSVPWSARCHHIPHDYYRFTKEQLAALLTRNNFPHPEIHERGNDIGAIAAKLVVLTIRLLTPARLSAAIWTIPVGLLVAGIASVMLISAHISDWLGGGSEDDPLGYFVRARCIKNSRAFGVTHIRVVSP